MPYFLVKYDSGIATGKSTVNYTLTILKVSFFGLIKRYKYITVELNQYHSFKNTFDNWDRLIKHNVNIKNYENNRTMA